jgi:hypothetical protein
MGRKTEREEHSVRTSELWPLPTRTCGGLPGSLFVSPAIAWQASIIAESSRFRRLGVPHSSSRVPFGRRISDLFKIVYLLL